MSLFSNRLCWRSNEFCHAKGNYNNKTDIAWNSGELILLFCYKLIIKTHFLFENLVFESSHWWTAEGQQCSTKMKRSEIYLLNQYLLQAGDNYIFSIELFYWLNTTVIIITFNFPVAFKCPPKAILIWSIKASSSFPRSRFFCCVNLEKDPGVEFSTKRRRHTVHLWATKRNTDEITISFGWKEQVKNEKTLILANYSVKTSLLKFGKHISRRG